MNPPRPTWSRYAWFAAGFCTYTFAVGIWALGRGLGFWAIMPGCMISGLAGGVVLSVATYLIQTGYMQRGRSFYRLSERPVTFVMDTIMVVVGLLLCGLWLVGYTLQETRSQQSKSEQVAAPNRLTRSESDFHRD
ncbi:hypothetical protein HNR46_004169 [Haloferula luteola]|uniref:Uncharacterized protein n=1 Tax=Haloferula luteola TaxID=595692 RepID=A0A840VEH7_9BACT|nr:hypothetical protein [Haloferula luteola]MBB5353904.1 hypothetical protein [Haloferula luteola]